MADNFSRLDTNETAIFKRQTEYIKRKTYDVKFKNLKAKRFIPVSMEVPSGSASHTWRSFTKFGIAKIIDDYGKDFPRVDVYGKENTSKVFGQGVSFGYSVREIRQAQLAGLNLSDRRAIAARRAIEEKQDSLAWNGDADHNIQGFLNYPGITEATLTTGTAGDTWALKTPDEIIADMVALENAVSVPTNGVEAITQILLPRTQYNILKNTRMTDGNDKTVLTYYKDNNPGINVDVVDLLSTAGDGGTTRMIGYVLDPDYLQQEIPQIFEMADPDKEGMEYKIPCHAEFGGVNVYYPLSVAYMDGI